MVCTIKSMNNDFQGTKHMTQVSLMNMLCNREQEDGQCLVKAIWTAFKPGLWPCLREYDERAITPHFLPKLIQCKWQLAHSRSMCWYILKPSLMCVYCNLVYYCCGNSCRGICFKAKKISRSTPASCAKLNVGDHRKERSKKCLSQIINNTENVMSHTWTD